MSCNSFSCGCGGCNSGSKRIEMELTVKCVFPSVALCINRCTVMTVCAPLSLICILCSHTYSASTLKMSLLIFLPHLQCLNANSVGDGVEQATLWKDEEVR